MLDSATNTHLRRARIEARESSVNTSVGNEWKTAILGMIIGRGLREKIVVSKGRRRAEKGGGGIGMYKTRW